MTRHKARTASLLATVVMVLAAFVAGSGTATARENVVTTPANVQVEVGPGSVTVSWDASSSTAGDISIYYVKLGSQWLWTEESTMTLSLQPNRTFTLSVQTQDEAYNRSEWSDPTEFTTSDEPPVTTPSNVQVDDSTGSMTVTWEPSSSDAGIREYVVSLRGGTIGHVAGFASPPSNSLELCFR